VRRSTGSDFVGRRPETLALVAVIGTPAAAAKFLARECLGTRTPINASLFPRREERKGEEGTNARVATALFGRRRIVNDPGQCVRANAFSAEVMKKNFSTCANEPAIKATGFLSRPFIRNT